jgi:hypothetical protein
MQTRVSRFYGVSWSKSKRMWEAQLQHAGQRHYLGIFAEDKEEDAARAYDTAARNLRGANVRGKRPRGRSKSGIWWRLNYPTHAETAARRHC